MDWIGLYLVASLLTWGALYYETRLPGLSSVFAFLWPFLLFGMFVVLLIAPEPEDDRAR